MRKHRRIRNTPANHYASGNGAKRVIRDTDAELTQAMDARIAPSVNPRGIGIVFAPATVRYHKPKHVRRNGPYREAMYGEFAADMGWRADFDKDGFPIEQPNPRESVKRDTHTTVTDRVMRDIVLAQGMGTIHTEPY